MKILYVNPCHKECGIYQFGKRVAMGLGRYLKEYGDFEFHYYENYDNYALHQQMIEQIQPEVVVYSFNSTALPVAGNGSRVTVKERFPAQKHIAVCHEQEQIMVDHPLGNDWQWFGAPGFDAWVGHDPTLVIEGEDRDPLIFQATRPVLRMPAPPAPPEIPTFGSSTFGFPNKGHVRVVEAIQNEYDEAIIRFNMPPSIFGDRHLALAKATAERCRSVLRKPGIQLQITHDLLETEEQVVEFLMGNSVNIFDYDQHPVPHAMRGVASSPDSALATRRPLIITGCTMFRHLWGPFGRYPEDGTIRQLIERQERNRVPQLVYNEWSPSRMAAEYARIFLKVTR